jgi:hypothetical protein
MSELLTQRINGADIFVITLKVLINSINISKKVSIDPAIMTESSTTSRCPTVTFSDLRTILNFVLLNAE